MLHLKKIQVEKIKNASPENLSDVVALNIPELLCGIFGLQLLYKSEGFYEALDSSDDPFLARKYVGSIIWKTAQKSKGLLGDGKSQYLICRHDYRVPALLRGSDNLSFPTSDLFRSKISPIIGSIGKEKIASLDARTLVGSWIYHMAENAYEHGCVDVKNGDEILEEYSGILIQKIVTPNQDMVNARDDLDEDTKKYILKLYQSHGFKNTDTITVITVMDSGKGIHNTLPEKYDSYSDIEKLNAAYTRGVTRHNIGEVRSGYGLFDSIRAARKLKACVTVCSGNIYSSKTFESLRGESIKFDEDFECVTKFSRNFPVYYLAFEFTRLERPFQWMVV